MTTDREKREKRSYAFYGVSDSNNRHAERNAALELSHRRLHPSMRDLDYLVLRRRISILARWIESLPDQPLTVLDIGGRVQPYRPLFSNIDQYIAVDLVPEGLVDVIADAHLLPVSDNSCDAVVCTQVLSYISAPATVISECFRVLRPAGTLFLTVPSFFPQHHDEKWRFTNHGIKSMLEDFERHEVVAECFSFAGLARSLNYLLHTDIENYRLSRFVSLTTIPMINLLGRVFDTLSRGDEKCTANYCARAVKPGP